MMYNIALGISIAVLVMQIVTKIIEERPRELPYNKEDKKMGTKIWYDEEKGLVYLQDVGDEAPIVLNAAVANALVGKVADDFDNIH